MTWIIGNFAADKSVNLTLSTAIIFNIATVTTNETNIGNNVSNEVIVTITNDNSTKINDPNGTDGPNEMAKLIKLNQSMKLIRPLVLKCKYEKEESN